MSPPPLPHVWQIVTYARERVKSVRLYEYAYRLLFRVLVEYLHEWQMSSIQRIIRWFLPAVANLPLSSLRKAWELNLTHPNASTWRISEKVSHILIHTYI
ncbi:hypothetical protein POVWA2_047320 [Plasmodium ovale wallikeri]|uniref:Uncharacterized protein n=1 Tax=Plasmodium ovale wallikeri TaxID=864142 RepID=A0A1A8YVZ6_PLAOA|nr:hypothetical protein POVWA1_029630 [Plasmodium ovale wallikeri]SBT44092.1 hypothetical protein POVWA2_047320 [Plasmodium ovale wallikeri]